MILSWRLAGMFLARSCLKQMTTDCVVEMQFLGVLALITVIGTSMLVCVPVSEVLGP